MLEQLENQTTPVFLKIQTKEGNWCWIEWESREQAII
jgi:hypothetical protein